MVIKTLKEAILVALEGINKLTNYSEVYNYIIEKNLYDFGNAKTPPATVSAQLGDFIRNSDTRVKRIKQEGGTYSYYLTKNENDITLDTLQYVETSNKGKKPDNNTYLERSLHKLLSSYLKSIGYYSKTIFHEESTGNDNNQTWTHPDMVGITFLTLQTKVGQSFIKSINRNDTFKINSYEIKREINTDAELKKAFFQAVSNSSWANFGYLVALEISDKLNDEMKRLNQSFGIGIIKLDANPYQSKVLYMPSPRVLDFQTIDKLCNINTEFQKFIEQIEKLMTAEERYYKATLRELEELCDDYFNSETEIVDYCKEKNIPME